ncbi:MAG TPA: hypothetical protein ENH94_09205, partial [Phycisphaerales bacterium]|nr:hypothetical protein [Phycisphaerales bacterium]
DFKGVDETVIEKFAEEAGREAKKPLIDMGEGDLLLMMFLAAGLGESGNVWQMFAGLLIAFMPTQIPLGVFEGFLAAGAYKFIKSRRPEMLVEMCHE